MRWVFMFALLSAISFAGPGRALAQSGGAYDLHWAVIAGGGGSSSALAGGDAGAEYRVDGTVGQAGADVLQAGDYILAGGFWNRLDDALTAAPSPGTGRPTAFALHPVGPNPSVGMARIAFDLPRESAVRLVIYGIDGGRVRALVSERLPAGRHSVSWDGAADNGRRLTPGVYLVRFEAGSYSAVRRLIRLN
jgi:hypothetical protein